jgi:hypothetical protein
MHAATASRHVAKLDWQVVGSEAEAFEKEHFEDFAASWGPCRWTCAILLALVVGVSGGLCWAFMMLGTGSYRRDYGLHDLGLRDSGLHELSGTSPVASRQPTPGAAASSTPTAAGRNDQRRTKAILPQIPEARTCSEWPVRADGNRVSNWQTFRILQNADSTLTFKTAHETFLTCQLDGTISADGRNVGEWQIFRMENVGLDNTTVTLWAKTTGKYLSARPNGSLVADGSFDGQWSKFKLHRSEDGGIVLQAAAIGKYVTAVSTRALANYTDFLLVASQTYIDSWARLRVAPLNDGHVSLRGVHGRYVTALKSGAMTVNSQTLGGWQSFKMHSYDDGTIALRSYHGKWVTAYPSGSLVADGKAVAAEQRFRLTLDPDGSASLQSSFGTYVSVAAEWYQEQVPLAERCPWDTGIATYAGKDKQMYVDGAIMLGISLQRYAPGFPRVCMVVRDMSFHNKQLLAKAGWHILEVDDWHANQSSSFKFGKYYRDVYSKINAFRLCMRKVLFMDADMFVLREGIEDLLRGPTPPPGHIGMAPDGCNNAFYQSGFMLFRPNISIFAQLRKTMHEHSGQQALDQPVINEVYRGRVRSLDLKYNSFGPRHASCHPICDEVVVAHFTGNLGGFKPSAACVKNLEELRAGHLPPMTLDCPDINREYFCALKRHAANLSPELQHAVSQAGECTLSAEEGHIPLSV